MPAILEMTKVLFTRSGHGLMKRVVIALILCLWVSLKVMGRTGNSTFVSKTPSPSVVNFGALFTLDSVIGRSAQPAILAAVDDVNSDSSILKGTKLNVIFHDTNCSGFLGTVEGKYSLMVYGLAVFTLNSEKVLF